MEYELIFGIVRHVLFRLASFFGRNHLLLMEKLDASEFYWASYCFFGFHWKRTISIEIESMRGSDQRQKMKQ